MSTSQTLISRWQRSLKSLPRWKETSEQLKHLILLLCLTWRWKTKGYRTCAELQRRSYKGFWGSWFSYWFLEIAFLSICTGKLWRRRPGKCDFPGTLLNKERNPKQQPSPEIDLVPGYQRSFQAGNTWIQSPDCLKVTTNFPFMIWRQKLKHNFSRRQIFYAKRDGYRSSN